MYALIYPSKRLLIFIFLIFFWSPVFAQQKITAWIYAPDHFVGQDLAAGMSAINYPDYVDVNFLNSKQLEDMITSNIFNQPSNYLVTYDGILAELDNVPNVFSEVSTIGALPIVAAYLKYGSVSQGGSQFKTYGAGITTAEDIGFLTDEWKSAVRAGFKLEPAKYNAAFGGDVQFAVLPATKSVERELSAIGWTLDEGAGQNFYKVRGYTPLQVYQGDEVPKGDPPQWVDELLRDKNNKGLVDDNSGIILRDPDSNMPQELYGYPGPVAGICPICLADCSIEGCEEICKTCK